MAAAAPPPAAALLERPTLRHHVKTTHDAVEIFDVDARYSRLRYISSGAYGCVCSARDESAEGERQKCAIKKIKSTFRDLTDAKRILRELKLLRHLGGHDNVIFIRDVMTAPQGVRNFADIYIVTELYDTDLFKIIDSPQVLSEQHLKYFLYQLLRGLKFLHSAGVLHRDLKPQNVLCNASCELAIADLGLARFVRALGPPAGGGGSGNVSGSNSGNVSGDEGGGDETAAAPAPAVAPAPEAGGTVGAAAGPRPDSLALTQYVVTRWYRAPELLVEAKTYGPALDVWSVGCIFAEMLGRRPLLPGRDVFDQLRLTLHVLGTPSDEDTRFVTHASALKAMLAMPRRPRADWAARFPLAPPQALDLLDRMMQFNPSKRISVEAALAHPFLADYASVADEPVSSPIDQREWSFDTGRALSKADLQALMLREVAHFRPSGSEERVRPTSTRLAAMAAQARASGHGPVAPAAAAAAAASAAPPARPAPAAPAPPKSSQAAANSAAAPTALAVAAHPAAASRAPAVLASTAPAPAAPAPLASAASAPQAPAPMPVAPTAAAPAPAAHSAAAPPAPAPAPVPVAPADALVAALVAQMQLLRADLLASVDAKLSAFDARMGALERRVAATTRS